MSEEELLDIIKLQDKEITLLTGALQCMTGDAPCVKMIKEAMEIKGEVERLEKN